MLSNQVLSSFLLRSCLRLKHRKSAKLPWRHNIELSFGSLSTVFLSFCVFVSLSCSVFLSFLSWGQDPECSPRWERLRMEWRTNFLVNIFLSFLVVLRNKFPGCSQDTCKSPCSPVWPRVSRMEEEKKLGLRSVWGKERPSSLTGGGTQPSS